MGRRTTAARALVTGAPGKRAIHSSPWPPHAERVHAGCAAAPPRAHACACMHTRLSVRSLTMAMTSSFSATTVCFSSCASRAAS